MKLRILPDRLTFALNERKESGNSKDKKYNTRSSTNIDKELLKACEAIPRTSWRPLNDSNGRILCIAINYPSPNEFKDRKGRNAYNKIYTDLVFKLMDTFNDLYGEENKLKLLTVSPFEIGSSFEGTLSKLEDVNSSILTLSGFINDQEKGKIKAVFQGDRTQPEMWLQDRMIIAINETGKYNMKIWVPNEVDYKDATAYSLIEKWEDFGLADSCLTAETHSYSRLVGGNVLFVGDYVLVGADNINSDKETEEDLKQFFSKNFNIDPENVIILRNQQKESIKGCLPKENVFIPLNSGSFQPLNHLDLFITPLGKDKFKNDVLVIGKPINLFNIDTGIFKHIEEGIEHFIRIIRNKMEGHVSIYRNPMPLIYIDQKNKDSEDRYSRYWCIAPYNNSIIQFTKVDSDKNVIWMPTYGKDMSNEYADKKNGIKAGNWEDLKYYDDENERIFTNLGFKVVRLTNYLPFLIKRGGPRCLTKVLVRQNRAIS